MLTEIYWLCTTKLEEEVLNISTEQNEEQLKGVWLQVSSVDSLWHSSEGSPTNQAYQPACQQGTLCTGSTASNCPPTSLLPLLTCPIGVQFQVLSLLWIKMTFHLQLAKWQILGTLDGGIVREWMGVFMAWKHWLDTALAWAQKPISSSSSSSSSSRHDIA